MKQIKYTLNEKTVILTFWDTEISIHILGAYNMNTELVEIYQNEGNKLIIDYLKSKNYIIGRIDYNIRWWY